MSLRYTPTMLVLGIFLALPLIVAAQDQDLPKLRSTIDSLEAGDAFSGRILAVRDDSVIFEHTAGLAHRRPDRSIGPETRFQLASLTKQFTAALILKLTEEGRLGLDKPFGAFLSWYPADYRDSVTLHQLLTHQSGISNYTSRQDWPALSRQAYEPKTFAKEVIAAPPLAFQPGSGFSYSNSNYYLLGLVAEEVTGQHYADLLGKYIFGPLRMTGSGTLAERDRRDLYLAPGYERLPNGFIEEAPRQHYSTAFSVSGAYSTPEDLLVWSRSLTDNRVLPDSLRRHMLTSYARSYGYGLLRSRAEPGEIAGMIREPFSRGDRAGSGLDIIWHWGSNPGYNTLFLLLPEEGITVIILENLTQLGDDPPTYIPDLAQDMVASLLK